MVGGRLLLRSRLCGSRSHQSPAVHAQTHSALHGGSQAGTLIRVVRENTERFRDVKVAEAEGYALAFGCVSGGEYGAMGLHYVNFPWSSTACWTRRVPRS